MMAVLLWFQQPVIAPSAEPIVLGGLIGGAGVVLLWFANRFMAMMKMMQSVTTALFGDPNVPEAHRNGAIRKLDGIDHRLIEHTGQFELHIQAEQAWQAEMYGAVHRWNEHAVRVMAEVTDVVPPPLILPPPPTPPERRKKPRP